jgi:hypothetical protein
VNLIKALLAEEFPEGVKDFMGFLYLFAGFGTGTSLYKGPAIVSHIAGRRCYFQNPFEILNKKRASSNQLIVSKTTIDPEIKDKNVPAGFQPLTGMK